LWDPELPSRSGNDRLRPNASLVEIYEEGERAGLEKACAEGFEEGRLEGARGVVVRQLEALFGPIPEAVIERLNDLDFAQLLDLAIKLLKARSLKTLGLDG
jgi:hypothetical protein